jgi:hypothetical protein
MSRPCPECKSHNTRQMDREHYGDQAYCLSCYNKFRSVNKATVMKEVKSVYRDDRSINSIKEKINRIEKSLAEVKAALCIEQSKTGAR